jgi:hypothetical protein
MAATPSTPGWVYILTNPALPGMVKVGLTTRSLTERAAELTAASGVPLPFVVAWGRAVTDCAYVEKAVHRMLDDRRVSGKREFFRCDVATARQVIEAAAGAKLGRYLPPAPRKAGRGKGRRKRGRDLTGFGLLASGAALVALLVVFKPPLGWLPGPVGQAFAVIERLGG